MGRFSTNFVPLGNLIICVSFETTPISRCRLTNNQHNFDTPGKIGTVGGLLGQSNVNIKFMSVAPITIDENTPPQESNGSGANEALMILGVDPRPDAAVLKTLIESEGILDASVIAL